MRGCCIAMNKKSARYLTLFLFAIALRDCHSPGWIASDGQTLAHVPQSTQRSGLIEYFSPSEIASDGHSSMHVPHAMQSSLITYAIAWVFKFQLVQKYSFFFVMVHLSPFLYII